MEPEYELGDLVFFRNPFGDEVWGRVIGLPQREHVYDHDVYYTIERGMTPYYRTESQLRLMRRYVDLTTDDGPDPADPIVQNGR